MFSKLRFSMLHMAVLVCLLGTAATGAYAGTTVGTVEVVPRSSTQLIPGNEDFTREIVVESGSQGLGSYDITVTFDPAVINITAIRGGNTAEFAGPPNFNSDNFTTGSIPINAFQSSATSPTGSVSIMFIDFTVVATPTRGTEVIATSDIGLSVTELNDLSLGSIQPNPVDGTVRVTQDVASSDVSLTKTATPDTQTLGGNVIFTLTVSNAGPDPAEGVTVTDVLPAGLSFVSGAGCTVVGGTVTCDVGTVAANSSQDVAITVRADALGTVVNTASVMSATPDNSPGNNESSASVDVVDIIPENVDLSIQKTVSTSAALQGDTVTWTVVVSNSSQAAAPARSVNFTDTLPEGLTIESVEGCDSLDGLTCFLGDIAPGASRTVTIVTSVSNTVSGVLTNTVDVATVDDDTNAANDVASADLTVEIPTLEQAFGDWPVDNAGSFTESLVGSQLQFLGLLPGLEDGVPGIDEAVRGASIYAEGVEGVHALSSVRFSLTNTANAALMYATEAAYRINLDQIETQLTQQALTDSKEAVAALLLIGSATQQYALDFVSGQVGVTLSGPFEVVMSDGDTFTPAPVEGRSIDDEYLSFFQSEEARASRTVDEPYSGLADLDGDGEINRDEREANSGIRDYGIAASGASFGGGGSSGCFIATAAYGTPLAGELTTLRLFRDRYLLSNQVGTAFTNAYYRYSPAVASYISEREWARTGTRLMLAPVVWLAGAINHHGWLLLLGALFVPLAVVATRRALRVRSLRARRS